MSMEVWYDEFSLGILVMMSKAELVLIAAIGAEYMSEYNVFLYIITFGYCYTVQVVHTTNKHARAFNKLRCNALPNLGRCGNC